MKDVLFLEQLDQLKAIADPLRLRLLEAFADGPFTTKQVAHRIDESATKLYHHVDALERAGLIELVRTQQNRGTMEKYFSPVARRFQVRRDLLSAAGLNGEASKDLVDIYSIALEETAEDIRLSSESGLIKLGEAGDAFTFTRFQITGTKAEIETALARLKEVVDSIRPLNRPGSKKHGLTVAFYPIAGRKRKRSSKK